MERQSCRCQKGLIDVRDLIAVCFKKAVAQRGFKSFDEVLAGMIYESDALLVIEEMRGWQREALGNFREG